MQFPPAHYFLLSIPEPHVLLITINRPKQFNALNPDANWELNRLLDWAEDTDEIWCIVVSYICSSIRETSKERLRENGCRSRVLAEKRFVQEWILSTGTRKERVVQMIQVLKVTCHLLDLVVLATVHLPGNQ